MSHTFYPYSDERAAEIHALTAERDALKKDYEQACLLVAQMHRAAMNDVIGPKRGVVEDILDLRTERDALAATVQKLRDGIRFCIDYKAMPSSELLQIGYEAERDELTSRVAFLETVTSPDSLLDVNAICDQRDTLAAQNQEMREQFSKILTMPSSMCWPIARDGLASKNLAEEVLKRRGAKVLRSVTKGLDTSCGWTENILFIADELEQGE
jgi:hypothetical protein